MITMKKWPLLILLVMSLLSSGCVQGIAYENLSGTTLRDVTVSWDGFRMHNYTWGGGIFVGVHGGFPDKFTFSWEDSRTGKIKSVELDVPKDARGYPWGGLKMLIHSNGVIEVMHSRNGKKVGDHGYKRKITDQW